MVTQFLVFLYERRVLKLRQGVSGEKLTALAAYELRPLGRLGLLRGPP